MDAKADIKSKLPSRHLTEGPARAPLWLYADATGLTPAQVRHPVIGGVRCWNAEAFKKTSSVPGLKPAGRYVAKDMFEIAGIQLLSEAVAGNLNAKLSDAELAARKTKWKPRATHHTSGALWKYAQQVGPAVSGAVTHPGGAHEKQCYADI